MIFSKQKAWPLFFLSLVKCLAWPFHETPWLLLVPLAVVGWVWIVHFLKAQRLQELRPFQLLLALGFWVLLQSLAISYARGGEGISPANRYFDTVSLGSLFFLLASIWPSASSGNLRWVGRTAAGLLLCFYLFGIVNLTQKSLAEMEIIQARRKVTWKESIESYWVKPETSWLEREPLMFPYSAELGSHFE